MNSSMPPQSGNYRKLNTIDWSPILFTLYNKQYEFVKSSPAPDIAPQPIVETVLNQLANGVLVCNLQGKILFLNDAAKRLIAPHQDDIELDSVAAAMGRVCYPNGEEMPLEEWSLSRALGGETIVNREERIVRPDGSYSDILVSGTPLHDNKGTVIAAILTCIDITERNQAEAHIRQLNQALEQRNAELQSQQAWWQAVVEGMSEEVWVSDREGQMSLINLSTATKMELEEFTDKSVLEVLEEVDIFDLNGQPRPPEAAPLLRSLRGEIVRGEEIMRHRTTGKVRYRQFSSAPIRDPAGTVNGAVAIVRDVTDQKRTEQALQESEARYRGLFTHTHAIIAVNEVIWNEAGQVVDWIYRDVNPRWEQVTGKSAAEVIGKRATDLFGTEAMQPSFARCQQVIATGEAVQSDAYFAWNDTSYLTAGFRLTDKLYGTSSIEITELKRTEKALRESERQQRELTQSIDVERARLAAILEHLPVGVWIADQTGQLIGKNKAADRIWMGDAPLLESMKQYAEYTAWDATSGKRLLPEDYPVAKALVTDQVVEPVEMHIRRFDGTEGTVLVSAAPIKDGQGQTTGIVGINVDITDRKRAELLLRESEARFRQLADAMPQLVWTALPDGTVDYYNQRYQEFVGIQPESGGSYWEWASVLHPDDMQRTIEAWQASVHTGQMYQIEHRVYHVDGSIHWYLSRGIPVRNEEGQIVRWYGTSTDIHEQKMAEERITLLQQLTADISQAATIEAVAAVVVNQAFQAVGGHMGSVALLTEDGSAIELVNTNGLSPEAYQRFKRTPLDFPSPLTESIRTGEPIWIATQADYVARYPAIASIITNQTGSQASACIPLVVENRVIGGIGISFPQPVSFTPDERDFFLSLAQQCAQAIERARLYDVVQQERDKLRVLLDSMNEEVWFCDMNGQIQLMNRTVFQGLGFSEHQPLPQWEELHAALDVRNSDGTPRLPQDSLLMQSLQQGKTFKGVETIIHHLQTGEPRYRQASSAPIHNEVGEIVGAVEVVRDITDQKHAEQQALELAAERERSQALTRFVQHVSHDFKTPLSTLMTSLYLLARVPEPGKQQRQIEVMQKQTQHIADLLERILTMTRLDSEVSLEFQPVNLNQLVQQAFQVMQLAAEQKGVTAILYLTEVPVEVTADLAELGQALSEIMKNAVQFTPEGGVVTVRTDHQPEAAIVEIQDTGLGIDKTDQSHIFERLYRADSARSADTGGMGLGLAIAQKIITLHGGTLAVTSTLGVGSTFQVKLPLLNQAT